MPPASAPRASVTVYYRARSLLSQVSCVREGRGGEPSTVEQLVHGCAALYLDLLTVKNDDPDWTGLPEPPPCWEDVERALGNKIVHS